jgi:hypothetical protein
VVACVGSATHEDDYAAIVPAITEILRRHRGRVRFFFWGAIPRELEGRPGVESDPTYLFDYRAYARRLCGMPIDLALVPLRDNPFNRAKSAIKFLELSAAGIPGVYADLPPYASVIRDGEDGLLAGQDPAQWVEAIETLLADSIPRLAMAGAAWSRVRREFAVERILPLWEQVIAAAMRARRFREGGVLEVPGLNPIVVPAAALLGAEERSAPAIVGESAVGAAAGVVAPARGIAPPGSAAPAGGGAPATTGGSRSAVPAGRSPW